MTDLADAPAEEEAPPPYSLALLDRMLEAPTLGAVMRRDGITGWCEEARIAFAHELVLEAIRRAAMERLEGIFVGLDRCADPRHIARRLRALADELDPPDPAETG